METGRIFGLPAHPLFVHALVVLVPLCAIGVVLCALWPAARRRLSLTVLVLSVFSAAMVPIVQASGEWFEDQVGRSALLERHRPLQQFAQELILRKAMSFQYPWGTEYLAHQEQRNSMSVVSRNAVVEQAAASVTELQMIEHSLAKSPAAMLSSKEEGEKQLRRE